MDMDQYLNLLNSLSASALNIWGFLLTVSLGIVAFLGSNQTIDLPIAIALCILFSGFSQSNHTALKKNFDQRIAIVTTMNEIAKTDSKFSKELIAHARIVNLFDVQEKRKKISLRFQIAVSLFVILMVLGWPIYQARLKANKDTK